MPSMRVVGFGNSQRSCIRKGYAMSPITLSSDEYLALVRGLCRSQGVDFVLYEVMEVIKSQWSMEHLTLLQREAIRDACAQILAAL
jgi:hypothetical protein